MYSCFWYFGSVSSLVSSHLKNHSLLFLFGQSWTNHLLQSSYFSSFTFFSTLYSNFSTLSSYFSTYCCFSLFTSNVTSPVTVFNTVTAPSWRTIDNDIKLPKNWKKLKYDGKLKTTWVTLLRSVLFTLTIWSPFKSCVTLLHWASKIWSDDNDKSNMVAPEEGGFIKRPQELVIISD